MSEPPAIVPPGMSPKNAGAPKGPTTAHRLTAADFEGLDISKMKCIGCQSYGCCSNKIFYMPEDGSPIFICNQRKELYAQENGLDLPF